MKKGKITKTTLLGFLAMFSMIVLATSVTVITDTYVTSPEINEHKFVIIGNASDIQTQINNCPAGGCIITIPAGIYNLTSSINITTDNVILEGQGNTTFLNMTGGGTNFTVINATTVENIAIKNMKLMQRTQQHGIFLENTNYSLIEGVYIEENMGTAANGMEWRGINMRNGRQNIIRNNYITGDAWDAGITINTAVINTLENQGNLITGNMIWNVGGDGAGGSAATGSGIENEANTGYYSKYNIYSNNIIITPASYGLRIIECSHCIIEGNNIYNASGASGVWVDECEHTNVIGNNIDNSLDGIEVRLSNYTTISSNQISSCDRAGISVLGNSTYTNLIGNTLYNNSIDPLAGTAPAGIEILGAENGLISSNLITQEVGGGSTYAIFLNTSDTVQPINWTSTNNYYSGFAYPYYYDVNDQNVQVFNYPEGISNMVFDGSYANFTDQTYFSNTVNLRDLAGGTSQVIEWQEVATRSSQLKTEHNLDQMLWTFAASTGRQLVLGDINQRNKDFGHAVQNNPTLYIHSASDPTASSEWISFTHNTADAIIDTGVGDIAMQDNVTIPAGSILQLIPTDAPPACDREGMMYGDDSLEMPCYCLANGSWVQFDNFQTVCT